MDAFGEDAFGAVVAMYIADFVPRVRAGLEALGVGKEYLGWVTGPISWDHNTDLSAAVFNGFLPAVARMRALDPVTSELVRLRGAAQHNCRVCKSLREVSALDAGGSETLYGEIERFDTSVLLDVRAKAALRYADALIWTPAHLAVDVAVEVRSRFSDDEAVELTLTSCATPATRLQCRWVLMRPGCSRAPNGIALGLTVRRCSVDGGLAAPRRCGSYTLTDVGPGQRARYRRGVSFRAGKARFEGAG